MTIPTYITLGRMALVPVFMTVGLLYGFTLITGNELPALRLWVQIIFAVTALSDALDGFIAKKFNMRSEVGAYLDPFADKLLLLNGIVLLTHWTPGWWGIIPLWTTLIVIFRDVVIIWGISHLRRKGKTFRFIPHWSGKVCTVLQMSLVVYALLNLTWLSFPLTVLASLFTIWSGVVYYLQGRKILQKP